MQEFQIIIIENLFNIVDQLNGIASYLDRLGSLPAAKEIDSNDSSLDVIFSTISGEIKGISQQAEDNVKGLKMSLLD